MLYLIGAAAIIKIGVDVLGYLLDQKTIAEKNHQNILRYRRELLRRKTEYKARAEILDYFTQIQKDISKQLNHISTTIIPALKNDRTQKIEFRKKNKKQLTFEQKKQLNKTITELKISIESYYAEKYRLILFSKELSEWKRYLTSKSTYFKLAQKIPLLDLKTDNYFLSTDFPFQGKIVNAIVKSPIRDLKFLLDGNIWGYVKKDEKIENNKLKSGQRIQVFIRGVNYKLRKAVVSLEFANLYSSLKESPDKKYKAIVQTSTPYGALVKIKSTECFLPKSLYVSKQLEVGAEINVKIIEIDNFNSKIFVSEID
ncbi:MAG: S1 RNA-binding domain-containing protein [Bacteroidales bacterium]